MRLASGDPSPGNLGLIVGQEVTYRVMVSEDDVNSYL